MADTAGTGRSEQGMDTGGGARAGGTLRSLALVDEWQVPDTAAGVVLADGTVAGRHGPTGRPIPLASVTKPLAAYAVLVAVEEGAVELDEPAGPPGSTVRHLLAHASGLAFEGTRVQARPGERRIYSNSGFEVLADQVTKASGIPFPEYLRQAVFEPLGMRDTGLTGSPAKDAVSTVEDLLRFAAELQAPKLLDPATVAEAASVVFPGLSGVLPGFGNQKPNDWGLGFEIRGGKHPHWTGASSSPRTFGHFGQSGTFLWVDPEAGAACVVLTGQAFGPWAAEVWPFFTDAVLAELREPERTAGPRG